MLQMLQAGMNIARLNFSHGDFAWHRAVIQFSYGVSPIHAPEQPRDWNMFARQWVRSEGLDDGLVVLAGGPSRDHPKANHCLEIIDLRLGSV